MVDTQTDARPDESLLEQTIRAAAELKAANAERKALLDREEAMQARAIIGGRAEAGKPAVPQISEEQKAADAKVKAIGNATGAAWAKRMT